MHDGAVDCRDLRRSKSIWGSEHMIRRVLMVLALSLGTFSAVPAAQATSSETPPSAAAVTGCTVGLGGSGCTSGSISANSSGHFIDYWVMGGTFPCFEADYRIVDAANGVTVRSGHVGSGSTSGRVPGLYSRYYIRITNSCWDAEANIDNV